MTEEPLYNLSNALTNNTQLSRFFKNEGLTFVDEKDKVNVIYNRERINWKAYDSPTAQ